MKACHQPSYKEAVVERWDELKEADLIRDSSEESEAENDDILTQIENQDKHNSSLERRERDPTMHSSQMLGSIADKGH